MGPLIPLLVLAAGGLFLLGRDKGEPKTAPTPQPQPQPPAEPPPLRKWGRAVNMQTEFGRIVWRIVTMMGTGGVKRYFRISVFDDGRVGVELVKQGAGLEGTSGGLAAIIYTPSRGEGKTFGTPENLDHIRYAVAHKPMEVWGA